MRLHGADGLHGKHDALSLMEERTHVAVHAAMMREPVAIETGEASGGLRLINGRVVRDPGITLRYLQRIQGELLRKRGIEKIGVRRSAAMMNEAYDRMQPMMFDSFQHAVSFRPVTKLIEALPMQSDAQGLQAECREEFQIRLDPCAMT